ncbi:MAG: S8 family serine peptidase, partial [Phycisphaerales bacterium]
RAFARVELDGAGGLAELPDDPSFSSQYSLRNTGQVVSGQTGLVGSDVRAEGAWSYTTGNPNLVIAVLDSGIDAHPELAGRILAGINVPDGNTVTTDECNHGTHVAGILAAAGNNGTGMAGMTWNAKLLPVVVVNGCTGFEADVAAGLTWATDQGAKLANMSLQFYLGGTPLQQAVQYAHAQGVLMVAATGNNGNTNIAAPARYNQTIAVAATDNRDVRASFSNYGAETDIAAPGVSIYSLSGTTSYSLKSGTSFSVPHVMGAAALLWSYDPTLTRDEVRTALLSTARDLGTPGTDQFFGAGCLDAAAALASVPPPYAPEDLNQDGLVNAQDLAIVLAAWGPCADCDGGCAADLNGDCLVDAQDLSRILAAW